MVIIGKSITSIVLGIVTLAACHKVAIISESLPTKPDDSSSEITYYSSSLVESKRVKFEPKDNCAVREYTNSISSDESYVLPEVIIPNIKQEIAEVSDCDVSKAVESSPETDEDFSYCSESLDIPSGETDYYGFMDYRTLTDTSSKQWELQQSAWTDWQGFRRIGNDYCVALGTYYGEIGDRFRVITDKGNSYTVIEADVKGNDAVFYNDYQSWYHVCGDGRSNVVEFIVQTEYLPQEVTIMGDCGTLNYLGGNIIEIAKLE